MVIVLSVISLAFQFANNAECQTLIDFDDESRPCAFNLTTALREDYISFGVSFEGPRALDGGGVLDECGHFGVYGYSPPNFLAFNGDSLFSDGGIPMYPETITFDIPAVSVSMNIAGDSGGTVTVEAYDSLSKLVDSDSVLVSEFVQDISVAAPEIKYVKVYLTGGSYPVFIIDDLSFVTRKIPVHNHIGSAILLLVLSLPLIFLNQHRL